MGLFDKAKRLLGLGGDEGGASHEEDGATPGGGAEGAPPGVRSDRGGRGGSVRGDSTDPLNVGASRPGAVPRVLAAERAGKLDPRRKDGRPPLKETAPQGPSVEDALSLRETGDKEGARKIFREIDKGGGLRGVLHAASVLEAGDKAEFAKLLPAILNEEPRYKLLLQVAGALGNAEAAAPYIAAAAAEKAPGWALGWAKATAEDAEVKREGLVELVFADHALARTVACRDLHLSGVEADPDAAARYASFSHGRDSIRRFGASQVAALLDEAGFTGGRGAPANRAESGRTNKNGGV